LAQARFGSEAEASALSHHPQYCRRSQPITTSSRDLPLSSNILRPSAGGHHHWKMRAVCRPLRRLRFAAAVPKLPDLALEDHVMPAQPRPRKQLPHSLGLNGKEAACSALYAARMHGIYTTKELQEQIVLAPSFSQKDSSPFLLENFFEVPDEDGKSSDKMNIASTDSQDVDLAANIVNPVIHSTIRKYFRPDLPATFLHDGEEWLTQSEGHGTRKRATAHAIIVRGSGVIKVNGEEEFCARWPLFYNRVDICQPFKLTGTAGVYDVFLRVEGGGAGGQSGAARLAVARALFKANPACHDRLQEGFCLLEDTRQRMSKMPGKAGARKGFPWTKR